MAFQYEDTVTRYGGGSLGGKGRGIAFLSYLLQKSGFLKKYNIRIPATCIIGSDEFDRFIDSNELQNIRKKGLSDLDISRIFLEASLSEELIEALKEKFNDKIAIVTGRGFNAISSSLKEILNQFNVENSVFLEDESRDLAKPNPQSLIRAMKGLNSKNCLYVGDSMEDMILAQKASELDFKATFCGIYGSGKLPDMKKKLFAKYNVPLILESINQLPDILMIKKA